MAVSAGTILPLLLCSAIEISAAAFSASGPFKPRNWGYSLAVGITSLFVCAAFLLLAERKPDELARPIAGGPSLQTLLACERASNKQPSGRAWRPPWTTRHRRPT
jgi:hypothetical protein